MKKNIILGVLVLTSLIAFAQSSDDSSNETTAKFWGTACHTAKSREVGKSSTICCYYVFWINAGCKEVG